MDYGVDSYTTPEAVETYLARSLDTNETAILAYVIPAASRWIDRALGSNFDKLDNTIAFGAVGSAWTQRKYRGGYREINIQPCQNILKVEAISPFDFSVWYTYSSPLEYTAEPYDHTIKNSLRMNANEFTGNDLRWPGDVNSVQVTAIFSEYDYTAKSIPRDIIMLCNHISAVWLQNNQNTDVIQQEQVEGHEIIKRIGDLFESDPMFCRILDSRSEVWLDDM